MAFAQFEFDAHVHSSARAVIPSGFNCLEATKRCKSGLDESRDSSTKHTYEQRMS